MNRMVRSCTLALVMTVASVLAMTGCCLNQVNVLPTLGNDACDRQLRVHKFMGRISPTWAHELELTFSDANVSGVLMWIESGGGSVPDAKLLAHGLTMLREKYNKPFYVFTEYALMSGAYWAATVSDSIFAAPSAGVGSIGVWMRRVDVSRMDSLSGIDVYTIRSGELKTTGDPHVKMSPNEFIYLMQELQRVYVEFVSVVFQNRFEHLAQAIIPWKPTSFTVDDSSAVGHFLLQISDGEVYDAEIAQEAGLIDGVGYFDEIVAMFEGIGWFVVDSEGRPVGLFMKE